MFWDIQDTKNRKGLSNMCNIAHVKVTKSSIFSLKTNNYWLKVTYLIYKTQVPSQSYCFKLLNMCKFAHDRKTQIEILKVKIKTQRYSNKNA